MVFTLAQDCIPACIQFLSNGVQHLRVKLFSVVKSFGNRRDCNPQIAIANKTKKEHDAHSYYKFYKTLAQLNANKRILSDSILLSGDAKTFFFSFITLTTTNSRAHALYVHLLLFRQPQAGGRTACPNKHRPIVMSFYYLATH